MNKYQHTFAICAYKESPFLEECVKSLIEQECASKIIMITSTPNELIQTVSMKYNIPLFINEGEKGIVQDWNFAYRMADTKYVTIAHQDDVYLPHYTKEIMGLAEKAKNPLILFTDYAEVRGNSVISNNTLLKIKRILLFPLRFPIFWNSKFVRRRSLSLGCGICCPAVTMVKDNLPEQVFTVGFRSNEDWEAWERLSKLKGAFAYSRKESMYHRIHDGSETSVIIGDNARGQEDYVMFTKFWPKPIAKLLTKVYSLAEKSNDL